MQAACCGFDLCHMYIWYLVFAKERERNSGLPGGDREGFSSRRLAYVRGRIHHTHVHVLYGHSYSAYACAGPQVLGPHLRHEQAAVPAAAVRS